MNDTFDLGFTSAVTSVNEFTIYDRWGNQVYTLGALDVNASLTGWNGRFGGGDAPEGVYVYVIEYILDGRVERMVGDLTLIR